MGLGVDRQLSCLPHAASTQRWPRKITLVEFLGLETTAGTIKMGLVLLGSANAASTECILHGGRDASQRRYVGARGKILFVSAVREFSRPGS